jgi:hypothetical protein
MGPPVLKPSEQLLSQKALAQLLCVDRITIWRWHEANIGPPRVLIKKRYYYVLGSVREWFKSIREQDVPGAFEVRNPSGTMPCERGMRP